MLRKRVTFGSPREITNAGDDSRSFLFPFSMVVVDLVGAPDEACATTAHRLTVTVARNRLPAWGLSESELVKVLFEIGQRAVAEKAKTGRLGREERVMVSTASHPPSCPFDPSRISEPDGGVLEIIEETRMGFR